MKRNPSGYPVVILAGAELRSQMQALVDVATANTTWAFKRSLIKGLHEARIAGSLQVLGMQLNWVPIEAEGKTDEGVVKLYAEAVKIALDHLELKE